MCVNYQGQDCQILLLKFRLNVVSTYHAMLVVVQMEVVAAVRELTKGDCSSFIIDCIPLSATFNIVSSSFADFSAVLIFFCCTASTSVAGGGSLELSGTIWNGGPRIDGGVVGIAGISPSVNTVSSKSFISKLSDVVADRGEKCPKLNIEEVFDSGGGGSSGGRGCGGGRGRGFGSGRGGRGGSRCRFWWRQRQYSRESNGSISPFNLWELGYDWKNVP